MKKLRFVLNTAATIGLVAAVSLADSLYPSTKELVSSVVILIMSVIMFMVAKDIKNITSKKIN
ncbi:hypothetical protein [uncultured Bacteroides sp.]|uniref:hypothetical protein n=1 Tax=uncultured Bacteroides sp. TaxID=162156 RepID=UPI0025F1030E|nr:hypothetical protein [uncultured Bacteroides sp.]